MHGCDAHEVAKTCKPDADRFCWIRGDPSFESLRQVRLVFVHELSLVALVAHGELYGGVGSAFDGINQVF